MNRFDGLKRWAWSILVMSALAFAMAGCEGDDGAPGATGPAGADGADGADGVDATAQAAQVESCATCHSGAGDEHQAVYDLYVKGIAQSAFDMTFTSFTTVPGAVAGTFDGTLNATILKNGLPYQDLATLEARDGQAYFSPVNYDGPNQDYSLGRQELSTITQPTPGNYVITGTGLTFDPTITGQVYGYIAEGPLLEHGGGTGGELPTGTHVHLYENVANAAIAFGDAQAGSANEYLSAANVGGCVKCHGNPYMKHGYRAAEVAGIPDFSACKTCHYSGRNGFLASLQWMVDDPLAWATTAGPVPPEYTYEGSIMNDTHMAHAMEFPYPQSMQNCATCHGELTDATGAVIPGTDKLAVVLDDSNFTGETCLSCHPLQGINAWPTEPYNQPHRAPALEYLWQRGADLTFHDINSTCNGCHGAGVSSSLTAYHTGYDVNITDENGVRYADQYSVSIEAVSYDSVTGLITVDFSASDPAVVPELLISFYGWDSKHFIVGAHERDTNAVCTGFRPGCQMEYVPVSRLLVDDPAASDPNPIFTEDAASAPPTYKVTADPSQWQLTKTDLVPAMIADGTVRRIEVTVTPELNLQDLATPGPNVEVVLTAVNATLDLGTNLIDDDWFKGNKAVVSTAKCNACHDALASSFHSESGRGGDGIEVCKNCHTTTFPASHMEMASRSIDSYVHTIHSFQDFDVDDTFNDRDANRNPIPGFDPVFAKRYDQHIKHVFPNFTIRNCEACHVSPEDGEGIVVYNVPDQSESMPGVLQTSFDPLTWYEIVGGLAVEDPAGRSISGSIPEFVTGPASRACGSCHRSRMINRDQAGNLASLNAHTDAFGTFTENGPTADDPANDDAVLFEVIDDIMSLFE
jgi:OmcA/MtrC family decaheme c-type cytochrome